MIIDRLIIEVAETRLNIDSLRSVFISRLELCGTAALKLRFPFK